MDTGGTAQPGQIAAGLSIWPTGLVTFAFLSQLGSSVPSTRPEILSAVFFSANIGLWIFLSYAALATARRKIDTPERAEQTKALLVWTLGALSFGVLAGYLARYGGSIYPFLYLFLAALFFSPAYRIPRWVMVSVLLVFCAATLVQSIRSVRLALAWQSIIAPERALHDKLLTLPQDGRTVYVVNAPAALASAPHFLNRAWGLNLNVVIINQFRGCTASSAVRSTQFLASSADLLSVRIPDCAVFEFRAAAPDLLSGSGVALARDGIGTYTFPDGIVAFGADTAEFGRTLMLEIQPKTGNLTVVGYNWQRAGYDVITRR